jgi:hypothetical protein
MSNLVVRNGDLQSVVAALNERNTLVDDLVVPATRLVVTANGGLAVREGGEEGMPVLDTEYTLSGHAGNQLAEKLDIPGAYWRRMANGEHHLLLAENANYWLGRDSRSFLVRTLRGGEGSGFVRAIMSNSYQAIDDLDVLLAVLQGINAAGVQAEATVSITERKMVANITAPGIEVNAPEILKAYRDPRTGRSGTDYPVVSAGIAVSNSEVGEGAFSIMPRIVFRVCTNGMTRPADAIRSVHLGSRMDDGPVRWSQDTHQKNLAVITARARDAVASFLDADYLRQAVVELERLAGHELSDPAGTIERVSKQLTFTQDQQSDILAAFIKGGDTTALGVTQAITFVAQQASDGDTAHELENAALKAGEMALTS